MAECLGASLNPHQIMNLSTHGYAVLPMNSKMVISSMGKVVCLKGTIEAGVKVKPRLLNVVIDE